MENKIQLPGIVIIILLLCASAFGHVSYDTIEPNATDAWALGTISLRWSDIFGVDGNFSGALGVFKADPEIRLTDTGDSEYGRLTRSDTDGLMALYNRVYEPGGTGALDFEGAADAVDIANHASIEFSGDMTVVAWVLPDTSAVGQILYKRDAGGTQFQIYVNLLRVGLYNGVLERFSNNSVTYGVWNHIAAVISGGNVQFYVNGSTSGGSQAQVITSDDAAVVIGNNHSYDQVYEGRISELALWDKALSANDISDMYNGGAGLFLVKESTFPTDGGTIGTNLQGLWHLSEGVGDSVADSSANSNDGTLNPGSGSPAWVDGLVTATGADTEVLIASSQDGTGSFEEGVQIYGDGDGRTIITGQTMKFQIGGVEKGDIDTSGNVTWVGNLDAALLTSAAGVVIADAGDIGSASDTDAIQIEADGDIIMSQDLAVSGTLEVTGIATLVDGATITGTIATGLDMSGGTFATAVQAWPATPVILSGGVQLIKVDDASSNMFIGSTAFNADDGASNIAIGYQAGYNNLSSGTAPEGDGHCYIGYQAGKGAAGLSIGTGNLAIGFQSLYKVRDGDYNIAIGNQALYEINDGDRNTAVGGGALRRCISGQSNLGIGKSAGEYISSGQLNTCIGTSSGGTIDTGRYNVSVGASAMASGADGSFYGSTAIGYKALFEMDGGDADYNVGIGYSAGYLVTDADRCIFIGPFAGYRQTTTSDLLIMDNQLRADAATEATNAILYGTMAAATADQLLKINGYCKIAEAIQGLERASDPTEPATGEYVIWMSDGTGKGDDGDVLIASNPDGTTKFGTLFDYSGGAAW